MDRYQLTALIREVAADVGFDAVGFAPVEKVPPQQLRRWLKRGYQGQMRYLERSLDRRIDPRQILPDATSVISLAQNYRHAYSLPYQQPCRAVISRYAAGVDYHSVLRRRMKQVLKRLQARDSGLQGRVYVDTGPVLEKHWAVQAGLGWLGKHTNVLSRAAGSWFFLGQILLNRPLQYDSPEGEFCGSCTRCIDACPTGAIVEPFVLDARRCISYLTIELREDIPVEFRGQMGNLVFGCDICQDVCPWNRRSPLSAVSDFEPRPENRAPRLEELARLSPEEFSHRFQGSPIRRAKWGGLMRNVAVALGNSGQKECIRPLLGLLNCAEAMVRRHAGWALAQLGGRAAAEALQTRIGRETDAPTRSELKRLLHLTANPDPGAANHPISIKGC